MIEKTLATDEQISGKYPLHWCAYLGKAIMAFVFVLAAIGLFANDVPVAGYGCLFGLLIIGLQVLRLAMIEQVCTNKRVLWKAGIIAVTTCEIKLEQIESVQFNQSIIGRMLGFGNIVFTGTGSKRVAFEWVRNVIDTKRRIDEEISHLTGK